MRRVSLRIGVIFCILGSFQGTVCAQASDDRELLRDLAKQVEELRARIKELEARSDQTAKPSPVPESAALQTAAVPVSQGPSTEGIDTSDTATVQALSSPLLSIRGFGDVGLSRVSSKGTSTNSFGLGQVDFFVTSQLASRFGLLMETVLESGPNNDLSIDLERFLFRYRENRYFNVDIGRYHSAIGYFNTAYHHGTWFQTAITRPHMFQFEDSGGALPIHNVGLYLYGAVPSGKLDLHYTVEIGNGRDYLINEVQTTHDSTNGKSVNLAFQSRPKKFPGLELGGSWYRDKLYLGQDAVTQHIYSAYGVYNRGRLEVLTEFIAMRHSQALRAATYLPMLYTQWSYRLTGPWRPYTRYEFANPSPRDPVAQILQKTDDHFRGSYLGGLRYDFTEFAAAKFEVQRILRRNQASENRAAVNFAFTF